MCGTEPESKCRLLDGGRIAVHQPNVPADKASPTCKDGGTVFILDGFKHSGSKPGEKLTPEQMARLSDEHASDSMHKSLAVAREAARQQGCRTVTVKEATGSEMLEAYEHPKSVAVVHAGHGNQGTGHPTSADEQALTPGSLEKDKVSSRLKHVESLVCEGGKDAAAFQEKLPPGASFHGPDRVITTAEAKARAEGEATQRLTEALK